MPPLLLTHCRVLFLLQAAHLSSLPPVLWLVLLRQDAGHIHASCRPVLEPLLSLSPTAGLLVYFGYGIWHSKENLREPRPQRVSARYVVFPSGSLEERVQAVQPGSQPAAGLPDTDTDDCKR